MSIMRRAKHPMWQQWFGHRYGASGFLVNQGWSAHPLNACGPHARCGNAQ